MASSREIFLKHVGQTSPFPMIVDVDRAEGIYIYDTKGQRYADMTSGIHVSSLGHRNPEILKAVEDQIKQYMHTMVYGEHIQTPQIELAKKLVGLLPDRLNSVYFTNSGSEATEGAIKLSRRHTGRAEIIACRRGYHGSTIAAMSLMSHQYYTLAYQPSLPGVRFIDFNNLDDVQYITTSTAAVFMETVRGPAGIELPDPQFLKAVRERCDQTGTLLVLDEIQCGLGRTGPLFAFEDYGIEPDILLLAKALGGGMPIGALISDQKILNDFTHDPMLGYISTFGGHPVCCAAGLAGLNYLLNRNEILESIPEKEKLIKSILISDKIIEIRSKGLMMAIQLENKSKVQRVVEKCHEQGVLVDYFLFCEDAFRIAPPLIISVEEIKQTVSKINEVINLID